MNEIQPHFESDLNHLLVSENSEYTGRHQTIRDELFHIFGIYVKYSDTNTMDEEDKLLRDFARKKYIYELNKSGAKIKYDIKYGIKIVTVTWYGITLDSQIRDDGRSETRNVFKRILRKINSELPEPLKKCVIIYPIHKVFI